MSYVHASRYLEDDVLHAHLIVDDYMHEKHVRARPYDRAEVIPELYYSRIRG